MFNFGSFHDKYWFDNNIVDCGIVVNNNNNLMDYTIDNKVASNEELQINNYSIYQNQETNNETEPKESYNYKNKYSDENNITNNNTINNNLESCCPKSLVLNTKKLSNNFQLFLSDSQSEDTYLIKKLNNKYNFDKNNNNNEYKFKRRSKSITKYDNKYSNNWGKIKQ